MGWVGRLFERMAFGIFVYWCLRTTLPSGSYIGGDGFLAKPSQMLVILMLGTCWA